MAYVINSDECTFCGDCEPVCPTTSIKSGKVSYKINKDSCTECEGEFDEPQCVEACPVDGCITRLAA
ncbi:MAG: 4Fe-4S binding protein [Thiotrichaceae bacterium]|nr:4Fe-4S binding protein [Thiotrichaceae bacterium]